MKKLVGIYSHSEVIDDNHTVAVFPVYFDGVNYFLKCMSDNLKNLLQILSGLSNKEEIEEEIDAYINQENSLYSKKLIRYNGDSNYYYQVCPATIKSSKGFYGIESFHSVIEENMKEDYKMDTYAVVDHQKNLIVGNFSYVNKYMQNVCNLNVQSISKQEEIIQRVVDFLEINRFFA